MSSSSGQEQPASPPQQPSPATRTSTSPWSAEPTRPRTSGCTSPASRSVPPCPRPSTRRSRPSPCWQTPPPTSTRSAASCTSPPAHSCATTRSSSPPAAARTPSPPGLPGRHTPAARHQVVTLHSIQDAQQIREHLTRTAGPSRVAIYGGGFTGAETASALHAAGHHVALISRSRIPGRASFGAQIAAHITGIHRGKITTFLGRTITAVRDRSPLLGITLDDTTTLSADLLITALGNAPTAPGPFSSGVPVDDRLRSTAPHVYAAGSTAIHRDDHLGIWRLDHWADAAAQGQHAAAAVLHDRTGAADPGPYRPRSSYTSLIHGTAITGIGYTMTPATEGQGPGPGTLVTHTLNGALVGVSGVDAVATVHETAQHLHESAA
ncbi:MAG: FAD-dependent oxidoreductase [Microbacterium sp.]